MCDGYQQALQLSFTWLLLASSLRIAVGDTQTIAAAPGTGTSTAQCQAQGLGGECNSCVCCCYQGSSAFVNYTPSSKCTCERSFNGNEIKLAAVLAVFVLVPAILASCYLGGQLWISPYKKQRSRNESLSRPESPMPLREQYRQDPTEAQRPQRRTVELVATAL